MDSFDHFARQHQISPKRISREKLFPLLLCILKHSLGQMPGLFGHKMDSARSIQEKVDDISLRLSFSVEGDRDFLVGRLFIVLIDIGKHIIFYVYFTAMIYLSDLRDILR